MNISRWKAQIFKKSHLEDWKSILKAETAETFTPHQALIAESCGLAVEF